MRRRNGLVELGGGILVMYRRGALVDHIVVL